MINITSQSDGDGATALDERRNGVAIKDGVIAGRTGYRTWRFADDATGCQTVSETTENYFVPGVENIADFFTKPLKAKQFW